MLKTFVVFGFPQEAVVSDKHFLVFFPTPEGLEKKTLANSAKTGKINFTFEKLTFSIS